MLPNDGTYDIMLSKDRINIYVGSYPILIQKCVGLSLPYQIQTTANKTEKKL